ncbi:MAG: Crp/Fnr family transcriptional regulator [Deltaproteobacteria bacterium]|nr:Crp/Fnr family transcriptional regulator [Deltaproteobacteria bacterium]
MIIREIELFKGIDTDVMNKIAAIGVSETHPKGTVLFERGDEADRLYILEEGNVNLMVTNGGTLSFSLTEPGSVFGWSAMVEPGKYTASCICGLDSKVIMIERDKLDKIFDEHPKEGLKVMKRLGAIFSERLTTSYRNYLSALRHDTTPSYG